MTTKTELRPRLRNWYVNHIFAGKSIEQMSKMPKKLLDKYDADYDELLTLLEDTVREAELKQMVTILLSVGGELEITAKAIREAGPGYRVTSQPTSRLDGGLVYRLVELKEGRASSRQAERSPDNNNGKESR